MKRFVYLAMFLTIMSFVFISNASAVLLDFESPLPGGLVPVVYTSGTPVPSSAILTDQYSNLGIIFKDVALIKLGITHAASGYNGIGGINSSGNVDYSVPMTFNFSSPIDYFSVTTDKWASGGNSMELFAYALDGSLIGSTLFSEIRYSGSIKVELKDIGMFHSVVIDEVRNVGGIALDLVEFNKVSPVPEPTTIFLLSSGLVGIIGFRRKFKK